MNSELAGRARKFGSANLKHAGLGYLSTESRDRGMIHTVSEYAAVQSPNYGGSNPTFPAEIEIPVEPHPVISAYSPVFSWRVRVLPALSIWISPDRQTPQNRMLLRVLLFTGGLPMPVDSPRFRRAARASGESAARLTCCHDRLARVSDRASEESPAGTCIVSQNHGIMT
jgi:hypothetical protein